MIRATVGQFKHFGRWHIEVANYSRCLRRFSVGIHWWPTLENPWAEEAANVDQSKLISDEMRVDYVVSKDDFKWVEKLIPKPLIPPPPPITETPTASGWIAPNREFSNVTNANKVLPRDLWLLFVISFIRTRRQ